MRNAAPLLLLSLLCARGTNTVSCGEPHWAFQPIVKPEPPPDPSGTSAHPVDRFILAKLRERSISQGAPADKAALCRRAYFGLTGLPPSPGELDAFLTDTSSDAFPHLVDSLLASPRFGERWARRWLDVARYADTAGDNADFPVPEARLYRDYVIAAFNSDKPFDAFVREQVAGDILAREGPREKYAESVAATGFLALSRRYGTGPYELWHLTLEDSIETIGRAFLGLTLRCARCHDHKYDPVTMRDYYALYGILASTRFPWAGSEEVQSKGLCRMKFPPLVPTAEAAPVLQAFEKRLESLRSDIARMEKETPKPEEMLKATRAELRNLEKPGLPPDLAGAYAVDEGDPADAAVQLQGEPGHPGPVIPRGAPAFLPGGGPLAIAMGSSGRRELAEWLTRPDQPLVARVEANRIWQGLFGKGIVSTASNFGLRGEPPTHPELLDWLAAELVDGGWSVKRIIRLIATSRTYCLSSAEVPVASAADPANALYWRFDRRRLEAEELRDAVLATSGSLDLTPSSPHPFPGPEKWTWTQHAPFKEVYASPRRSIYVMTQRIQRHPFLALFDGPDTNATTESRRESTVPLQALYFLNDPTLDAEARAFAKRVLASSGDERGRVKFAVSAAWAREPREAEIERAAEFLQSCGAALDAAGFDAAKKAEEVWTSYARVLLASNEFAYVD